MKMKSNLVAMALLAVCFQTTSASAADGGSVTGMVLDGSRHPLAAISVRATDVVDPSKTFSTVSDNDGKFVISTLPGGSYLVSADTVNTAWVQKDDSPIVEVAASSTPNVTLVLIRTAELSPAAVGGHSSDKPLLITAIGVSSLALVGTVVTAIEAGNLEDDHDKMLEENFELQQLIRQLQNDIRRLDDLINRRLPSSPSR